MASATATRVPTQARAIKTRLKIVAAAEREFSSRGYAKATAASIARRARVATGSLYQYFPNKDAVLLEVARVRFSSLRTVTVDPLEVAPLPSDPSERRAAVRLAVRAVIEAVVTLHREDPGLHAVLTERRHADPQLDREWAAAEADLVTRIANLLTTWGPHLDASATAFVVFSMIEGSVHAQILGHPLVSDERLLGALVDAVVRVVLAAPPSH